MTLIGKPVENSFNHYQNKMKLFRHTQETFCSLRDFGDIFHCINSEGEDRSGGETFTLNTASESPHNLLAATTQLKESVFSGDSGEKQLCGNPEPAATQEVMPRSSLLLPDGTLMEWLMPGGAQLPRSLLPPPEKPQTNSRLDSAISKPNIEIVFQNYLSNIEKTTMESFINKKPVEYPGSANQTLVGLAMGGLVRTPADKNPGNRRDGDQIGQRGGPGSGDPGGGGQGGGQGGPGDPGGGTPITPGWTHIEIELDPKILGEGAKPYSKESCRKPLLTRIKALFQRITSRATDKFRWGPEDEAEPAENRTFLGLLLSHIAFQDGPVSIEEGGLVDMFSYSPSPVASVQGVKVDLSAQWVLSGVNYKDPRQFFTVVDNGDEEQTEDPAEVFLRPALVLAGKMLLDLKSKKVRPAIRFAFPPPHNIAIQGTFVIEQILPMLTRISSTLDSVFQGQVAAERLAAALEKIS